MKSAMLVDPVTPDLGTSSFKKNHDGDTGRWPEHRSRSTLDSTRFDFVVRIDLRNTTVSIVRTLESGGAPVVQAVPWTHVFEDADIANDAYETLIARDADLGHWNLGAMVFGPSWLDGIIRPVIAEFTEARERARALLLKAEAKARQDAEEAANAATEITAYFKTRDGEYLVTLELGILDDGEFWTIAFDERWERDRFWDWMKWNMDRFEEFHEFMQGGERLALERQLLREMLTTEQAVKKQGLGAGGRRPLRFWRGEL